MKRLEGKVAVVTGASRGIGRAIARELADIHKRCDEIVNKASKLKVAFSNAKFGVVVYYPFVEEHINIQNQLRSAEIDGIVFASESDELIDNAVRLLLATLRVAAR